VNPYGMTFSDQVARFARTAADGVAFRAGALTSPGGRPTSASTGWPPR
jgi:hypothetical protein